MPLGKRLREALMAACTSRAAVLTSLSRSNWMMIWVEPWLLRLVMERSAAAGLDPLADVRAVFGNDLAAVFAFDPNSTTSEGHFAIAGRQLTVRWSDDGDVFDHHWQARLPNEVCDDCGSALWVRVTGARDLLDAYTGGQPDEPLCERCDIPDWCRA